MQQSIMNSALSRLVLCEGGFVLLLIQLLSEVLVPATFLAELSPITEDVVAIEDLCVKGTTSC